MTTDVEQLLSGIRAAKDMGAKNVIVCDSPVNAMLTAGWLGNSVVAQLTHDDLRQVTERLARDMGEDPADWTRPDTMLGLSVVYLDKWGYPE